LIEIIPKTRPNTITTAVKPKISYPPCKGFMHVGIKPRKTIFVEPYLLSNELDHLNNITALRLGT
jgi:hypothetical protein